jgi:CubicO group peptidase (beta-lactamase class C family)
MTPPRVMTMAMATVAALIAATSGCTTYRLIRYGYLAPERQDAVFPHRIVRRADHPFEFARAPIERVDLDTITVREWSGRMVSWADYMRDARIRAFLVVRNDTILYERYSGGYAASTLSGSYSMAKSFTSTLLGIALGRGEIRSLDDSITTYVPELRENPAFQGVTLRNLLEMKSGLSYERMNGGTWHDLRSGDAEFYFTSHLDDAMARMHRAVPPGGAWAYSDADAQVLAWVLTNAAHLSLADQLEQRVWRRIGTEFDASWSLDRAGGMEKAATGVNATARDYARFARLYLHDGVFDDKEVMPRAWVALSTTLDSARTRPEVATWWRMQHRSYWWIPMQAWPQERDFFADGAKGQRMYVHRPSGTIIVELADSDAQDFPFRRITHYLLGQPYQYPMNNRN